MTRELCVIIQIKFEFSLLLIKQVEQEIGEDGRQSLKKKYEQTLIGHSSLTYLSGFSNSNPTRLVSYDINQTLMIWIYNKAHYEAGQQLFLKDWEWRQRNNKIKKNEDERIVSVKWNQDGTKLVVLCFNGLLNLLNISDSRLSRIIVSNDGKIKIPPPFLPDESHLKPLPKKEEGDLNWVEVEWESDKIYVANNQGSIYVYTQDLQLTSFYDLGSHFSTVSLSLRHKIPIETNITNNNNPLQNKSSRNELAVVSKKGEVRILQCRSLHKIISDKKTPFKELKSLFCFGNYTSSSSVQSARTGTIVKVKWSWDGQLLTVMGMEKVGTRLLSFIHIFHVSGLIKFNFTSFVELSSLHKLTVEGMCIGDYIFNDYLPTGLVLSLNAQSLHFVSLYSTPSVSSTKITPPFQDASSSLNAIPANLLYYYCASSNQLYYSFKHCSFYIVWSLTSDEVFTFPLLPQFSLLSFLPGPSASCLDSKVTTLSQKDIIVDEVYIAVYNQQAKRLEITRLKDCNNKNDNEDKENDNMVYKIDNFKKIRDVEIGREGMIYREDDIIVCKSKDGRVTSNLNLFLTTPLDYVYFRFINILATNNSKTEFNKMKQEQKEDNIKDTEANNIESETKAEVATTKTIEGIRVVGVLTDGTIKEFEIIQNGKHHREIIHQNPQNKSQPQPQPQQQQQRKKRKSKKKPNANVQPQQQQQKSEQEQQEEQQDKINAIIKEFERKWVSQLYSPSILQIAPFQYLNLSLIALCPLSPPSNAFITLSPSAPLSSVPSPIIVTPDPNSNVEGTSDIDQVNTNSNMNPRGTWEEVDQIMKKEGKDGLTKKDTYGRTIVHWICERGDVETMRVLLQFVELKTIMLDYDVMGNSPLMCCVKFGDGENGGELVRMVMEKVGWEEQKKEMEWSVEKRKIEERKGIVEKQELEGMEVKELCEIERKLGKSLVAVRESQMQVLDRLSDNLSETALNDLNN